MSVSINTEVAGGAALGDDANFAATVTAALATKVTAAEAKEAAVSTGADLTTGDLTLAPSRLAVATALAASTTPTPPAAVTLVNGQTPTLTRGNNGTTGYFNRTITTQYTTPQTLTPDATSLAGDFISIFNDGTANVTLGGVAAAAAGITLTAAPGQLVEAICNQSGTFDGVTVNTQVATPAPPVTFSRTGGSSDAVGSTYTAVAASGYTVLTWQWTRDDADIAGATSASYTTVTADGGKALNVYPATYKLVGSNVTITAPANTPLSTYDFTTGSLPAGVTFTAAGARYYHNAGGVLVSAATDTPAFEAGGLRVQGAVTNLSTKSRTWSDNSVFDLSNMTKTAGLVQGPDGAFSAQEVVEAATTGVHSINVLTPTLTAGTRYVHSWYSKKAGTRSMSIQTTVGDGRYVNLFSQIDQNGVSIIGRDTSATLQTGVEQLANGWRRFWMSWIPSATTTVYIRLYTDTPTGYGTASTVGSTAEKLHHDFFQTEVGSYPGAPVVTTTTSASSAEEVATIDSTGITSGTYVVEHDCHDAGPLLGNGATAVLSSTAGTVYRAKRISAIAFDGTSTLTCHDGGSVTTTGGTTLGTTLRLLATSAAQNRGHVFRVRYYSAKYDAAALQAATATPVRISTGSPQAWRFAGRNCLAEQAQALVAGQNEWVCRWPILIGSGARSALRVVFNAWSSDSTALVSTSAYNILDCAIENGSVSVPVTFSGLRTATVSSGTEQLVSDDVLPSSFSQANFAASDTYYVKVKCSGTPLGTFPVGRFADETGAQFVLYTPGTSTISSTDAVGLYTTSGAGRTDYTGNQYRSFSPIIIGKMIDGDPKVWFFDGDSYLRRPTVTGSKNFTVQAVEAQTGGAGAMCHFISSGLPANARIASTKWRSYISYANIYCHIAGIGSGNVTDLLNIARGYAETVVSWVPWPSSTSSNSFVDAAGQTTNATMASVGMQTLSLERQGIINACFTFSDLVRETTDFTNASYNKWKSDGTTFKYTTDGSHQSSYTNDTVVAPAATTAFNAITVPVLP